MVPAALEHDQQQPGKLQRAQLTLKDSPYISRDTPKDLDIEHRIIVRFQQQEENDLPQNVTQQGTEEQPERADWELEPQTSEDMLLDPTSLPELEAEPRSPGGCPVSVPGSRRLLLQELETR